MRDAGGGGELVGTAGGGGVGVAAGGHRGGAGEHSVEPCGRKSRGADGGEGVADDEAAADGPALLRRHAAARGDGDSWGWGAGSGAGRVLEPVLDRRVLPLVPHLSAAASRRAHASRGATRALLCRSKAPPV